MSDLAQQFSPAELNRADAQFRRHLESNYRRVDRMFVGLLLFQWILGIMIALFISPTAWEGIVPHLHIHVYAAIFLGGAMISLPIFLAALCPGTTASRQAIAVGQILYSSLLIHLTGGRIETHFHVFGSLAFLALYRDWRVLLTASTIVAIDHFLRGVYWPYSVYGTISPTSWRWIEHVAWVAFEDGVLFVGIRQSLGEMRSISNRQIALEDAMRRAESADRAKGAFLAQMSHEIRTPMTAILGYADVMALEGKRTDAVDAIRRNGRHLLTVLDDILDLSKIEAEQLRVLRAPVDVPELLRDIQHLLNPRALQRNTSVSLEMRNLPPAVLTDAVRLRQIILNLVTNAVKFTTAGRVSIIAQFTAPLEGPSGTLTIHVADTGIGLSREQQERLFKPFVQADDNHHHLYGGTGLGLVISQRLALLLGGQIQVESEVGVGSTFTLQLPVESSVLPATKPPSVNAIKPISPTAAVERRILIVDDIADNRRLLRRLLGASGFQVDVADDGESAVAMAIAAVNDSHPYDVILMDMLMPTLDGYEATRRLRDHGYAGLIIALTAHASPVDEAKCRDAGCDDFITKPFDCEQLIARIHSTLSARASGILAESPH